ncbi:TPA: hypothetical protein DIC20_04280 [Candidatus Dependentiae bacterium]|nr:MAG: hypothetical protein US03_C0004G0045 [candidate division TM6 bacterium GW2011_GWF2_36_131]KKQ03223.1 MAG: hypothetical protein US13_C0004G0045 [candidate division TM6 bacterium GW2011_GWE2_36_25]KKQ18189.1 MAG: hypothetical protein US32_C0029G0003 [candidate division TM6 bacterium GW2011_GWA2_36_9]HBR70347.1 hypothetical protein [Candidatus Dependentiae bacterium]HCU00892.1 hypothetical protein [Candidatus Dependentiae bacterium]
MKKLYIILTLFLPLIAMESDQREKQTRLRSDGGPHAFQPVAKRRKTGTFPSGLTRPLPSTETDERSEAEHPEFSREKMSIGILTLQRKSKKSEKPSSTSATSSLPKTHVKEILTRIAEIRQCPFLFCNRLCRTKEELAEHISIKHMGERPFKCVSCDKYFAQEEDLMQHADRRHKNLKKDC